MGVKKYFINVNEFINSNKPEFIYILGFLWADGYIKEDGGISMENKSSDFDNLYKIFIKTGNWGVYHRKKFLKQTNKYYNQSQFSVNDKILFNFLKSMDYDKKSYVSPVRILNHIPFELHNHFFRGYIDGDGSFAFYGKKQCKFNITSTINQDWFSIEKIFKNIKINNYKINIYKRKSGKSSSISISNKWDIITIGEYIYKDSDGIRLERKYDAYLKIKNSDIVKSEPNWDKSEILFLQENYIKMGTSYCSKYLHRTKQSIYGQVFKSNIIHIKQRKWTENETNYLIQQFEQNTIENISEHLNIPIISVKNKIQRLKSKKLLITI